MFTYIIAQFYCLLNYSRIFLVEKVNLIIDTDNPIFIFYFFPFRQKAAFAGHCCTKCWLFLSVLECLDCKMIDVKKNFPGQLLHPISILSRDASQQQSLVHFNSLSTTFTLAAFKRSSIQHMLASSLSQWIFILCIPIYLLLTRSLSPDISSVYILFSTQTNAVFLKRNHLGYE